MPNRLKELILSPDRITSPLIRPFQSFFKKEASSSILLMLAALIAFFWSNSLFAETYHKLWNAELTIALAHFRISKSLLHWINDGLMAYFFFLVGLEIKREMLVGELASLRKAALPIAAALGGMCFPALIYILINRGTPYVAGWGIPMATDIAFALGALAILGKRIPSSLKIFLSAFAIADDLGAVLVIALFYTETIVWQYLIICLLIVLGLALANFFWIRWTLLYALLGFALWFFILGSGLHATIAGVVLALFIPSRGKYNTDKFVEEVNRGMGEFQCPPDGCGFSILLNPKHMNAVQSIELACHHVETPLQRLEHGLHPWVAFLVVPLFALANGGLTLGDMDFTRALHDPLTIGILLGLTVGKPLGITLCCYLALKTRLASLPTGVTWPNIIGVGCLGGIGFTMSLFIANLSFIDPETLSYSKLGILIASITSAVIGLAFLGAFSVTRRR
jgi:NhaA family Na+:H+ antiporter